MNRLTILIAGAVVIAASSAASAGVVSRPGLSQAGVSSVQTVQYAQAERKDTVGKRLKRSWKNLVGYQFNVACPIPIPFSHSTCSETGKSREDARAKCSSRNPFCYVTSASR